LFENNISVFVAHFEVNNLGSQDALNFALQTEAIWSRNMIDAKICPDQKMLLGFVANAVHCIVLIL
jgi:hypothetical protein